MRHSARRDELQKQYNLIGLEMEAAGIMNILPAGIIRGVCDYADKQKTKAWQPYAAAVAAVYARGILKFIHPRETAVLGQSATSSMLLPSPRGGLSSSPEQVSQKPRKRKEQKSSNVQNFSGKFSAEGNMYNGGVGKSGGGPMSF